MTKQKTFKRRIRTRMEKTSESYSAARRQLLAKSDSPADTTQPAEPTVPQPDASAAGPDVSIAGPTSTESTIEADTGDSADRPSDQAIAEKTGRDWDGWFALLDEWGAAKQAHAEIARWLTTDHGVPGWWAQSITVAYERARGLRAPGQGRDGKYSVSASKTVNVPVERLFAAVADPTIRGRWLTGDLLEVTTASPPKSVRGRWDNGRSRVVIGFNPKGEAKSQIGLAHEQLADPPAAKQAKE